MKNKFIKVPTTERLPDEAQHYFTDQGKLYYDNERKEFYDKYDVSYEIKYFLEEIPDREDEMREVLEEILEMDKEYPFDALPSLFVEKIEQLLNK
jgi:hypothetical protein